MSSISTHVLDTTRGRPAAGIPVTLEFQGLDRKWEQVGQGLTDSVGRLGNLLDSGARLVGGVYRLTFERESYRTGGDLKIVGTFLSLLSPLSILGKAECAAISSTT